MPAPVFICRNHRTLQTLLLIKSEIYLTLRISGGKDREASMSGRGRGKETGGRGVETRPPGPPTVHITPTTNMTDMDRKGEEKAWMGTITMLNPEKKFGFLKADNGLPKEYTGDSLFFHFDVIKNSLGKMSTLTHGSKVKFILYKAKNGDKATLEKPKAFALYMIAQPTGKQDPASSKKGKDGKAGDSKKEKTIKQMKVTFRK